MHVEGLKKFTFLQSMSVFQVLGKYQVSVVLCGYQVPIVSGVCTNVCWPSHCGQTECLKCVESTSRAIVQTKFLFSVSMQKDSWTAFTV